MVGRTKFTIVLLSEVIPVGSIFNFYQIRTPETKVKTLNASSVPFRTPAWLACELRSDRTEQNGSKYSQLIGLGWNAGCSIVSLLGARCKVVVCQGAIIVIDLLDLGAGKCLKGT